jgi:hypothetical protein
MMKRWFFGVISLALAVGCGSSTTTGNGGGGSGGSSCPSYATEVAPVVAANCTSCHSASGTEASLPLDTYANLKANATQVASQVSGGQMPQPPATISAADKGVILDWVACGALDN